MSKKNRLLIMSSDQMYELTKKYFDLIWTSPVIMYVTVSCKSTACMQLLAAAASYVNYGLQ